MSMMEGAGVNTGVPPQNGQPPVGNNPEQKPQPPVYDPKVYGDIDQETGRPGKVPEKYWDAEGREVRWSDVLEQHNFLSSKIGEKREKPPKEYEVRQVGEWTPPEGMAEDPVFKAVAAHARDALELSQSQFDGLMQMYWTAYAQSGREALQAEIASLGKDYAPRMEAVAKFAQANLSPENFQALYDGIGSAAMFAAIEELISKVQPPRIEGDGAQDTGDTLAAVDQLWNAKDDQGRRRVEYDPEYREMVRRRRAAIAKRGGLRRAG